MRFFLYSILYAAFFLTPACVSAQDEKIEVPFFSIRVNPFSFLESDAGVQIGIGYQWKKRWGATLDPMYIFYTPVANLNTNTRDDRKGLKIRSDLRYYLTDTYFGRGFRLINPFIAPEFHFKYVSSRKLTDFGINCVGQQCDYYMTTTYREVKREIGVAIKAGLSRPVGTRLAFEAFGGLGIRYMKFEEKDVPVGGSFVILPVHEEVFGVPDGKPSVYAPIGLKLVYSLY